MKNMLSILLVCLASCVFAQKSFFGVDAGINVANQRIVSPYLGFGSVNVAYYDNIIKPTFGFFYQYHLSEGIALRAGARYMALGFSSHYSSPYIYTAKDEVNINYLTLPLSMHYSANKHLTLNAGVYVSFTLGGTDHQNQDITKTYHKNDYGFSFGAEHDVYKNFGIGLNYLVGLKNIWLDDQNGAFKYTNRALQITVIYKFKKTN